MLPPIKINGLKYFLRAAYIRLIYDEISASTVVRIVRPVKFQSVNIIPIATGTDD
jgi:hypothetical protein